MSASCVDCKRMHFKWRIACLAFLGMNQIGHLYWLFLCHTKLQPFSEYLHVRDMPLWQGSPMDPIWPENEVGQIIGVHPPEIGAPVTPGMSHGTKIFCSKIFSYHPQKMLFYVIWGFVLQKTLKNEKNSQILHYSYVKRKSGENDQFSQIWRVFCKPNPQIT